MSHDAAGERFTTREHRAVRWFGYLAIFGVTLRRITELNETFSIGLALTILGLFMLLYASEPRLSCRFPKVQHLYFALQFALVQMLGLFEVYLDTWAVLYALLGIQAAYRCPRKEALVWGGLFVASTLVTLSAEFGLLSGLGRASAYIVIGLFFVLYDSQYAQREDAQAESQLLLAELQLAHEKLAEHAAQAEELAAAQERDRITRELHDAVGQKIFAIQLATESTFLLLEKDPQRATAQLDLLQEQTQTALEQMRQLIGQWRPR